MDVLIEKVNVGEKRQDRNTKWYRSVGILNKGNWWNAMVYEEDKIDDIKAWTGTTQSLTLYEKSKGDGTSDTWKNWKEPSIVEKRVDRIESFLKDQGYEPE